MASKDDVAGRRYSRGDVRGSFPRVVGAPGVEVNRLGVVWRPLIDMGDSEVAPMRLRMIGPVSRLLAEGVGEEAVWFSRIGVPGLRRQVVLHAGLEEFDCVEPGGLPESLRSPGWQVLVDRVGEWGGLEDRVRAVVVFLLAQLSFSVFAVRLTGVVEPGGSVGRDWLAYQVARVHARVPGLAGRAVPVFERLAASTPDPRLALLACFQGIGHGLQNGARHRLLYRFEEAAGKVSGLTDDWLTHLVRSRFHRALALFRSVEGNDRAREAESAAAWRHQDALGRPARGTPEWMLAEENRRYLVELEIRAATAGTGPHAARRLRGWIGELSRLDPTCVEARLVVGDGYAALGDLVSAARWYELAGQLGTVSGATGWYRAGLCHDRLGDRVAALNAMGHCLALDTTAVEPARYLQQHARTSVSVSTDNDRSTT